MELRRQGGKVFAESDPRFDYTCYLPRTYSVQNLDPRLAAGAASASTSGLPVRLAGFFSGNQVNVSETPLEAALLPLPFTVNSAWRGVVALRAGGTEMAITPGSWQKVTPPSPRLAREGLYRVTACTQGGALQLLDPTYLQPIPPPASWQGPVTAFLSEDFLDRSLDLVRQNHPEQFQTQWKGLVGNAGFRVDRLGLTTVEGGLRCFVRLTGDVTGLGTMVSGEWEAPVSLGLSNGSARLALLPDGQRAHLTKPVFAELPEAWSRSLLSNLARWIDTGISVPVPGAYMQQLLKSGLVTPAELESLQLSSVSWGDRRNGALVVTNAPPAGNQVPTELSWSPHGFGLGLSAPALNRCLATWVPAHLPLTIDLPAGAVPAPRVLIFKLNLDQLVVDKLSLHYSDGRFQIENCQLNVGWSLGPVSGVEPGARFSGWAEPALEGSPPHLSVRLHIDSLKFLSEHILAESPEEQARLRSQILDAVAKAPVPLPVDLQVKTGISPDVPLRLTGLHLLPDRLWLLGQWSR